MKRILIKSSLAIICLTPILLLANPAPGDSLWNLAAQNAILFCNVKSKICNLDFTQMFTSIKQLEQSTVDNTSLIEDISSTLDNLVISQIALDASLLKACIIEQHMQSANDNIIDAKDAIGEFISSTDIGTTGTTIGLPGKYILCDDVTFSPGVASNAITIDADNVELNLNGFTIRQGNATASTNAIAISADNTNINIYNGTLKDTTGNGIDIDTASCVYIENVWIENPTGEGIFGDSSSNIFINNVQATNASSDGLNFSSCDNLIIQNSLCTQSTLSGIQVDTSSSRITIKNCLCADNSDQGISLNTCDTFEIHTCFCANNTESGIRLVTCQNGLLKGNTCNENSDESISLQTNCTQIKIISNICVDNSLQGIELDTATNCYVFENIASLNGAANIDEEAGGPNTLLSNWALRSTDATNYASATSTINRVIVDQASTFPSEPTKWQNISMIL